MYLVMCTFDLADASAASYRRAYRALDSIGLKRLLVANSGKKVIAPTTTTVGQFSGRSAGAIRSAILIRVRRAFKAQRLPAEVFIVVAGKWSWSASSV